MPIPGSLLDYDAEAEAYDATRGGAPRAEAAAAAVLDLVPAPARTLLDLGCGTGIVTARLRRPGLRVLGADASYGMATMAARRGIPVVIASGTGLAVRTRSLDAVSAVWLLHLLREPGAVPRLIAEVARTLRPGGVFVTTVDKDAAHHVGADVDEVLAPHLTSTPADASTEVTTYAARAGMRPCGEGLFTGLGQGVTPRAAAEALRAGRYASRVAPRDATVEEVATRLEALPEGDVPRADPTYRLAAFVRD